MTAFEFYPVEGGGERNGVGTGSRSRSVCGSEEGTGDRDGDVVLVVRSDKAVIIIII